MYDFSLTSSKTKSRIATKMNPNEKVEGQSTDITQPLGHQMFLFHIHPACRSLLDLIREFK